MCEKKFGKYINIDFWFWISLSMPYLVTSHSWDFSDICCELKVGLGCRNRTANAIVTTPFGLSKSTQNSVYFTLDTTSISKSNQIVYPNVNPFPPSNTITTPLWNKFQIHSEMFNSCHETVKARPTINWLCYLKTIVVPRLMQYYLNGFQNYRSLETHIIWKSKERFNVSELPGTKSIVY